MANYDFTIYNALKGKVKVCRLTSSHDETITRCPYCGDSVKDLSHAHFYIQNKPPFKYYCQRCNAKGVFNMKMINMFNISSPNLIIAINNSYRNYQKQMSYKYSTNIEFLSNKKYDYTIDKLYEDYVDKLLYLQNRLGIDIEKFGINNFLTKYKVILNLTDFITKNKLGILDTRFKYDSQKDILKMVDEKFIGFMAMDKNFITFRNTVDDSPRYNNLRLIIDDNDSNRKIYGITNKLDLSRPEFNVHITEGVFDIMGVYHHICNGEANSNDIFMAANGKSHLLVMNTLLNLGITNCNINIYSDKDVNVKFYEELKKESKLLKLNGANIYYNEIGKDYGVRKDQIVLSKPISI